MIAHLAAPELETERLILRAPRLSDLPEFTHFMESERASFVGGPFSGEREIWNKLSGIAGMWALRGFGSFVYSLKDDGTPLGSAGPWFPATWPEKEIGWTVWSAKAEGKGYAFEAASATLKYAFETLGWKSPVSYIRKDNQRSIRLAERLGAKLDFEAETPPYPDTLVYRHSYQGAST